MKEEDIEKITEHVYKNYKWLKNKKDDDLPVDIYPTIMIRVNEEIKNTTNGYNKDNLLTEIKKY